MKYKIVLPTDFSLNATQAINYALQLFKNKECVFYFLNVYAKASEGGGSFMKKKSKEHWNDEEKSKSELGLAKLLDDYSVGNYQNTHHSFQIISRFGDPLDVIKSVVEEKDIDMIVMGTRGKTNAKSILFGSTAIDVMEKARNCPVVVVPQLAKLHPPSEIVFPTSYETHFKKRELSYLIDIAKNCRASIRILHIANDRTLSPKQLNGKELLMECFEEVEYSFHTLSQMPVPAAINCFVESRESDMVAFINSKHSLFGSILTQPLVKGISYNSSVPILVMHDLRN
ncbi:universal stress protein [Flavobacteriaceae bacterium F08102]|nr:universal stress protein [Flavobacteriaceae bacterium F08102]